MATIKTTTGQFTITDHNDAQSISSYIQASRGQTQVFNTESGGGSSQYNPDWSDSNHQVLTSYVYIGGSTTSIANNSAVFLNAKWYYKEPENETYVIDATHTSYYTTPDVFSYSATNQNKITILKNIFNETNPLEPFFFVGDALDKNTGISTHVVCTVTLSATVRGAAATYCVVTGGTTIARSATTEPNTTTLTANLYVSGSINTNCVYKWYKYNNMTEEQLVNDDHQWVFYSSLEDKTRVYPVVGSWSDARYIEISEAGVTEMDNFKVKIARKNSEGEAIEDPIYDCTVTVTDLSDPYDCNILSTAGSTFKNNTGTTLLSPEVKKGNSTISDLTDWHFAWSLWDQNGTQTAFVKKNSEGESTHKNIASNTADTFVLSTAFAEGDIQVGSLLKLVSADNDIYVIQVGSIDSSDRKTIGLCKDPILSFVKTSLTKEVIEGGEVVTKLISFTNGTAYICRTCETFALDGSAVSTTAGTSSTFTTSSALADVAVDSYVKLIDNNGVIKYVKIESISNNTYTIYTVGTDFDEYETKYLAITLSGLTFTAGFAQKCHFPSSGEYKYGNMATHVTDGVNPGTTEPIQIIVTSEDIDVKGTINAEAYQPELGDIEE